MKMKAENTTRIQFDSLSVNEAYARGAAAAFLARYDPTVPQLADLKTAVSEAVTNCIVHAYPDRVGPITMTVSVYPGRVVRIVIADKGVGIPDIPRAMEPLFTTGNPEERSGLGFAVMQSFMDKVSVRSAPGRGTRVILTKHLEAAVHRPPGTAQAHDQRQQHIQAQLGQPDKIFQRLVPALHAVSPSLCAQTRTSSPPHPFAMVSLRLRSSYG